MERKFAVGLVRYGLYSCETDETIEVVENVRREDVEEIITKFLAHPEWNPGGTGIAIDEQ